MTETQERFLKAVADRVPPERVVEVYLFPSLRQGPVESGVAVVAADGVGVGGVAASHSPGAMAPFAPDACDPTEDAAGGLPAAAEVHTDQADGTDEPARREDDERSGALAHRPPPPPHRLTIYTAHYRLTIKGPDRGKWEAGVAAEADAPLVTLEAVVRGVRHRAGEGAEAERLDGDAFRAAIAGGAAAWSAAT